MLIIECPYCGADNAVQEGKNGYTFICECCLKEVYIAK